MKRLLLPLLAVLSAFLYAQTTTVTMDIDNLQSINGNAVTLVDAPKVITTSLGNAVEFDGVNDGMQLSTCPITNMTEFTVEIILKPYEGGNFEQRYLHMQKSSTDDKIRMLLELRQKKGKNFWVDAFLVNKDLSGGTTLLDTSKAEFGHLAGQWQHIVMVFKNDTLAYYINNVKEMQGYCKYTPMNTTGVMSVGMRYNKVAFYKGAVKMVKVSDKKLSPAEFMSPVTLVKQINIEGSSSVGLNDKLQLSINNDLTSIVKNDLLTWKLRSEDASRASIDVNGLLTAKATGEVEVTVEVKNNTTLTATKRISIGTTSLLKPSQNNSLSLNIVNKQHAIEFELNQARAIDLLSIYNMIGNKICSMKSNENLLVWNTQDVPAGVYIYSLKSQQKTFNGKVSVR